MPKILEWLKHEISSVIYAILYFAITFNLISFSETLFLKDDGIKHTSYIGATLGAIFAGKVVLVANSLPFINAFPHKPIYRNILWKFSIYGFFAILIQITDLTIQILYHHQHIATAQRDIKALLSSPHFWGIQIWVLMLFFFLYCFFRINSHYW